MIFNISVFDVVKGLLEYTFSQYSDPGLERHNESHVAEARNKIASSVTNWNCHRYIGLMQPSWAEARLGQLQCAKLLTNGRKSDEHKLIRRKCPPSLVVNAAGL